MDSIALGLAIGQAARANSHAAARDALSDALARRDKHIEELMLLLSIAASNSAGYKAAVGAFKAAHPTSPLLAKTGKTYADGSPHTKGSLIFEKAFDAEAVKRGIRIPSDYRESAS